MIVLHNLYFLYFHLIARLFMNLQRGGVKLYNTVLDQLT